LYHKFPLLSNSLLKFTGSIQEKLKFAVIVRQFFSAAYGIIEDNGNLSDNEASFGENRKDVYQ